MPSKRDATAKKLSTLLTESKRIRRIHLQNLEATILQPAGITYDRFVGYLTGESFEPIAKLAFQLDPKSEEDAPLLAAFSAAELDHRNPMDWRALLSLFAKVHFERSRPGAQGKWDAVAWARVCLDIVGAYKKHRKAKPDDSAIAKILRSERPFKDRYQHYKEGYLRKLVRQARDPKINKMLRYPMMDNFMLAWLRADFEDSGKAWTPALQSHVEALVKHLIETAEFKAETPEPT